LKNLTRNLSKNQVQDLLSVSLAYRLGNVKHSDFYVYLRKLCQKGGLDFNQYPAMDSYIRYILISDRIQAENLFNEVKRMEEGIYQSLARTDEERRLLTQSKSLHLLGKLLSSSLTREEWEEYSNERHSRASGNPEQTFRRLDSRFRGNDETFLDLKSFEDFYKESLIRDEKISENVMKQFSSQPRSGKDPSVAVLVTGGFHSEGIEKILTRSNVAMITFTPKISKVDTDNGTAYLSVFTQEKTPLQKLFDGDKLFVTPENLPTSTKLEAAVSISAIHSPTNVERANEWLHKLPDSIRKMIEIMRIKIQGNNLEVTVNSPNGEVETEIQRANDLTVLDITRGEIAAKTGIFSQIKHITQQTLQKTIKTLRAKIIQKLIIAISSAMVVQIIVSHSFFPGSA
ncbi:MAG: hypothetical protein HYY63_00960, partial [Elusimicrobia bacterium]|nr:hypothetical protein [Elusimicrobiota bacterium]